MPARANPVTVISPVRLVTFGLRSAVKPTVPFPVPDADPVRCSHVEVLEAAHAQSDPDSVRALEPVAPFDPSEKLEGLRPATQPPPAWRSENGSPAIVKDVDRDVLAEFVPTL